MEVGDEEGASKIFRSRALFTISRISVSALITILQSWKECYSEIQYFSEQEQLESSGSKPDIIHHWVNLIQITIQSACYNSSFTRLSDYNSIPNIQIVILCKYIFISPFKLKSFPGLSALFATRLSVNEYKNLMKYVVLQWQNNM